MKEGRIYTGADLDRDTRVRCEVCIVGSGAGGAVLAEQLVARGHSVVMLEDGSHRTRRDFDLTEATAYPTLYQELGNRTTDDLSITLLQGRSVGGGTTVNWCSSFRTPDRILDHWREVHGVRGLTREALTPHWEALEERLHIEEWPLERINANNRKLWDGCGKLGYSRGLIRRNVHRCANLGYCGLGCPLDAKQSMLVTLIPDAVEQGLTVYANAWARRLLRDGRRVTGVEAEVADPATDKPKGVTLTVEAKVTAVCGGAVNSPALLLRSGLTGNGRVGKRTFLHPVVVMVGDYQDPVEPFSGAPQSVHSHHFLDRGPGQLGFFLEVAPVHPLLAGVTLTGHGLEHRAVMARLSHVSAMLGLTVDGLLPGDEGGTVRLRSATERRVHLDYPLSSVHFEAFRTACREMARLHFAAGATRVLSLHVPAVVMRSEAELALLDGAPWEKLRVRVVTAHQMGGCAMGGNPGSSVVNSGLRYHGLDNLFVVDGSALPTSLGVNPQETIFGLARWAAPGVSAAL